MPVAKTDITSLHDFASAAQLVGRITEICSGNYGHAGRLFLQMLTEPQTLADIKGIISEVIYNNVKGMCPADADPQVERVARRFVLAGYAGQIARDFEILPDDFDSMAYAKTCFDAWLENRGGIGASEDAAILSQVRLFIEQHGQSRFQDWNNPEVICINRVGFRKEDTFYCLPETFKAEVIKGYSLKKALEVLGTAGWLKRKGGINLLLVRLPVLGPKRVYILNLPQETE